MARPPRLAFPRKHGERKHVILFLCCHCGALPRRHIDVVERPELPGPALRQVALPTRWKDALLKILTWKDTSVVFQTILFFDFFTTLCVFVFSTETTGSWRQPRVPVTRTSGTRRWGHRNIHKTRTLWLPNCFGSYIFKFSASNDIFLLQTQLPRSRVFDLSKVWIRPLRSHVLHFPSPPPPSFPLFLSHLRTFSLSLPPPLLVALFFPFQLSHECPVLR